MQFPAGIQAAAIWVSLPPKLTLSLGRKFSPDSFYLNLRTLILCTINLAVLRTLSTVASTYLLACWYLGYFMCLNK